MYKQIWLRGILVLGFIIPFILYQKTLLPDVGFWDTGEFQTILYTLDIAHPTGYPTYILLGKLFLTFFSFGSIAWRVNLLSSIFVCFGLYVLSLLIKKITNNLTLSVLLPIFLSTNPYLWSIAIRADPHALHFLFTSLFLYLTYLILDNFSFKKIILLSFVTGLSLGNHMLSVFMLPSLILVIIFSLNKIKKEKQLQDIIFVILVTLLGSSVYLLLPITSTLKEPLTINYSLANLEGFKRHVLGQDFQGVMNNWVNGSFKNSIIYLSKLYVNSFPIYSWVLIIVGFLITMIKYFKYNLILGLIYILTIYFSLRYQNASLERYFIGSFLISFVWISIYLFEIFKKYNYNVIKFPIYMFIFLCIVFNIKTNYKKIDESKNISAKKWATETLTNLPKDSIVFSWWSYSTPLWYMQKVENTRKDITVINAGTGEWENRAIESNNPNVYFIQSIEIYTKGYALEQYENLYKFNGN